MSTVLLDTNIVSYLLKEDSRSQLYAPHLLHRELAISMMTVAELFQWSASRNWGPERIAHLEGHVESYTILPIDMELCRHWADIRTMRRRAGVPISPQDAWIDETDASFARLRKQQKRRTRLRRSALVFGVLMLILYAYLGINYDIWGTGLIVVPLGLGCIVGWAIEEGIVQISK